MTKFQSYELNIYKINNELTLEEYKDLFQMKKGKGVHCQSINQEEYSILYYTYTNKNYDVEIEWFKKWREFFKDIDQPLRRDNQSGNGIILIHLKNYNEKYAIIFGRSYTLIKDSIIEQFGMNMGSILFDGKSIDSISSKYFSINKNKSITSYYGDSTFDFDDNETVDLLKANIVDYLNSTSTAMDDLLKIVKRKASVGKNNLKLTIYKETITIEDIISVCKYITEISLKYKKRASFPQMNPVNDQISDILDKKLLDDIFENDINNFEFSVPLYNKSASDEFEFLNNVGEIRIKIGKNVSEAIVSLDSLQIFEFIQSNKNNIKNIRKIKILIDTDEDQLLKWIDAQTEYEGKTYALYDGKWFEFNEEYIKRINDKIKSIETNVIEVDNTGEYSTTEEELKTYSKRNYDQIKDLFGDGEAYKEFIYNFKLSKEKKYTLFDRVTFEGYIEVCDLYKDSQLIHCKIGKSSKLEECLRQSIYGTKYYYQKKAEIKNKKNKNGEILGEANIACVIFLSEDKNIDQYLISKRKSLRLKQTFIDWFNLCKQIKFIPKLIITKYKK